MSTEPGAGRHAGERGPDGDPRHLRGGGFSKASSDSNNLHVAK